MFKKMPVCRLMISCPSDVKTEIEIINRVVDNINDSIGFRFSFTPLPRFFSPFLHSTMRYRSLSSIQPQGVVSLPSHKVSRVSWYSGSCQLQLGFHIRDFHPLWSDFPDSSVILLLTCRSPNPGTHALRFRLFRFRSPLLTESMFLSLPPPTQMFQFSGFPPYTYVFSIW